MRKLALSLIGATTLLVTSCDFNRYGCTSHDALNYDEKANRSDQTCIFESSGIFWWDISTQGNFNNIGVTSMTIELNDELVASNINIPAFDTIVGAVPNNCTKPEWISFSEIVYSTSSTQKLELFNQNDSLFHTQALYINNGCSRVEIEY